MLQLASVRANKIRRERRDAQRPKEAATPALVNLRGIQFLKKVKRENHIAVDLYDELWEKGCDREELLQLWYRTCRFAGQPKKFHRLGSESDYVALSQAQIKNFVNKVRSWADEIERLNKSALFSPASLLSKGIRFAPEEERGKLLLDAELLESLPTLLRGYAIRLDFSCRVFRNTLGPGAFSFPKLGVYQLVEFVHKNTKSPRYEVLSEMLCAGFAAIYPKLDAPRVFNHAALQGSYLRAAKTYRHFPLGHMESLLDAIRLVASNPRSRDTD